MKIEEKRSFFKISEATFVFILVILSLFTFCIVNIPITIAEPNPPSDFVATAYNRTQIDITWSDDTEADSTLVEWNIAEDDTWVVDDHDELYNGSDEATTHYNLTPGTTYYYKAWSWNNTDGWSNGSIYNTTTDFNLNVTFSGVNPADGSSNQELSFVWNVTIEDPEGDKFNWTIECNNTQNTSNNNVSNGSKELSLSGLSYSTQYMVWVNATDQPFENWTREWFTFTTRALYTPDAPGSFTAIKVNRTKIDLTWSKGTNADYTNISYAEGATPPPDRNSGISLYNGTGTSTSAIDLLPGTQYSFAAWSWNQTDNLWSSSSSTDDATTDYNLNVTFSGVSPANGSSNQDINLNWSVTIIDPEGDLFNWTIICNNTQNNNSINASNGSKVLPLSNLTYSTQYMVWVNTTDQPYGNWTNETYNFTTKSQYHPNPPSSFTATSGGTTSISLSWTKGSKADYTLIRRNTGGYPSLISDGYEVYNGTASSTTSTGLSSSTTYYYRAWSWNTTGGEWSSSSATASATTSSGGGPSPPPPSNQAPTADAGGPYSGYVNAIITFNGSGSSDSDGSITGYRWDWTNDGTYDTDWLNTSTTTHSYSTAGTYTLKLQVKDNYDVTGTDTAAVTITQSTQNPPVSITNGPYSALTFENIFFDGTGSTDDGTITNYTWNLGDGTIAFGATVTHSYSTAGVFDVTLTVKDNDNFTSTSTTTATITLDSDADGWSDELEESYETNPNDPSSYPTDFDGDGTPDEDSPDGKYTGDQDDDDDGIDDETEENLGSNPKDSSDVIIIDIEGKAYYLADTDNNGSPNKFYDSETGTITTLKFEEGKYLIDTNGDGKYNYVYDPVSGEVSELGEEQPKGEFPWVIVIVIVIVLIIILIVAILFKVGYLYVEEEIIEEEIPEKKEGHRKSDDSEK